MKRMFRGRDAATTPRSDVSPSRASHESLDLCEELPIFGSANTRVITRSDPPTVDEPFSFVNDPNLNMNPSILGSYRAPSTYSKDLHDVSKSIFSRSRKSFSTKQSLYNHDPATKPSSLATKPSSLFDAQPLHILSEGATMASDKPPQEQVGDLLRQLYDDLGFNMNQFDVGAINLTTAVVNLIDCLKRFVAFVEKLPPCEWDFTAYNSVSVRRIIRIYLHFYDNLLSDDVYIKLKLLLVKNFNDFAQTLNSSEDSHFNATNLFQTIVKPQNYPVANSPHATLPNTDVLERIMDKMARASVAVKEQTGSFIAPIARGITPNLHILCLYFGYPNPSEAHRKLVKSLRSMYDDIHIVICKNQIELAGLSGSPVDLATPKFLRSHSTKDRVKGKPISQPVRSSSQSLQGQSPQHIQHPQNPRPHTKPTLPHPQPTKFKVPFRIPTDAERPPISLSLSIESSQRTSGTMGGYVYPIIDTQRTPQLELYANSKFAISCGHVCLDSTTGATTTTDYPHVSAPSSVLILLYKQALCAQYQKVINSGQDDFVVAQLAAAYGSIIKQVEAMFPLKRVKVVDPRTKQEKYEARNLPVNRFGQIIWGERTLVLAKTSKPTERKLLDLAIIKVNKALKCDQNFLGDDVPFNEFDPALMFDNLYVRKVVDLKRHTPISLETEIEEVDSLISDMAQGTHCGLPVFKYGSTTKYTRGNLNGIKLVYWLDGAIHSSEFIVNSVEHNATFAAGGDSGSWVLTKLEDIEPQQKGLGVLGMLHSYDGEFKQFGLFTPMCEILERLQEVTGIEWGVVGVTPEKPVHGVDSESDLGTDSEPESLLGDGELPPELD